MSFGWSAGDIVAALQLLHKASVALKDTGGASSDYQDVSSFLNILSVTLQHLNALQAVPLDPDLAKNLQQLCEYIQGPLTSFRKRIHSSFQRDLGAESASLKFLATGRKLQWAFSTSKKVKALREKIGEPIAAIGIVLSQQVVQTSLQMPSETQARIAHTIDTTIETRITPLASAVQNEVTALSVAQKTSSTLIEKTIRDVGKNTGAEIQKHSQEITLDLGNKFNTLDISQKTCADSMLKIEDQSRTTLEAVQNYTIESRTASMNVQEMISDLSIRHSQSTDTVLQRVLQNGQQTAQAIQRHSSASREQTSSLHQKLDRMNWLIGTVKDHIGDLSIAQQSAKLSTSKSDIENAIGNIQRSVLLLVSALHVLIRELIYLLAPYLVAIYRTSVQPLLLCGDHFLFEDAIGRQKWLPCLRFQHWDNFYHLLIDNFQGEAGLSQVLNGQFIVLNGFNEVPITKRAWRSGVQPKSMVTMAIMFESAAVNKGRCANPACPGQIDFGKDQVTRVCPICGKHISTLKDSMGDDEDFGFETAFSFDFGSDIQIPILKGATNQNPQLNDNKVLSAPAKLKFPIKTIDKDLAAFKRVILQDPDKDEDQEHNRFLATQKLRPSQQERPPHRHRGVLTRQQLSLRARKSHNMSSKRLRIDAPLEQLLSRPPLDGQGKENGDRLQVRQASKPPPFNYAPVAQQQHTPHSPPEEEEEEEEDEEEAAKAIKYLKLPMRGLSAYMFFANEQRENVRDENPGISFGQVGKVLGERWKALNEKQRAPYEAKAYYDKKRYEDEKASYNANAEEEESS